MKQFAPAAAALVGLFLFVTGCGGSDDPKIALLLSGRQVAKYERTNRLAFEKGVEEGCGGCEVLYSNAGGYPDRQASQLKAALRQGAETLVLDPAYSRFTGKLLEEARARGVPVVAYGESIPGSKPDAYVGFDFVKTGELQGEALAQKLREEGHPKGPIVMIKGEPGDEHQRLFEAGAHKALAASGVEIAREYYTPFWYERYAKHEMQRAIRKLGKHGFAGVYAETDSLAGGAVEALQAAGLDPTRIPTTGRNASAAALRRIEAGEQYMTVEEPVQRAAAAAARVALAMARGEASPTQTTVAVQGGGTVPALLVVGLPITRATDRS